jgi:hypothetical protein
MSSNTFISVGAGVAAAAIGFFTMGATAALFAFSIVATGTAMLLGPDTPESGGVRPDEFQINQSAEDAVIPVIFGTSRVSANFIRVDLDNFTATEIKLKPPGGKGGAEAGNQSGGFRYTVPLSYGICMGEIDALIRVIRSPGLESMVEFEGDGLTFTGGAPEAISLNYSKKQGEQTMVEGGDATFYPGSSSQGTATITDMNHREVCWIDFELYRIDGSPNPTSLLFEIRRMPKVLDDNSDPVPDFKIRASANPDDEEYADANPAAVAWEILHNPIWGKGMTTANLDTPSFIAASVYYEDRRIGISTAIGKQTVNSLMARLREIFGLYVWWDGEKLRARCIYDRTEAYTYRPQIRPDDVIGSPTFSRPSISSTFNEIRLEFTNRKNNWQTEVATAMDLAHVETVGGIRAQSMDGSEIGTRRAAELLAHATLRQMAYPSATCEVKVRRTHSGLQPGSFVRFVWSEWHENLMANTFWRVIDIEDDDQGAEGVTLTLAEDIYATAQFNLGDEWEDPEGNLDLDDPLIDEDLIFGDLTRPRPPGTLTPILTWEPNAFMTRDQRRIAVMPTRQFSYVQGCDVTFSNVGETTTRTLGLTSLMPIAGELVGAISATSPKLNRLASGAFDVELTNPAQAAQVEAATGLVITDTDDFSALTGTNQALLFVDGEIFRIGNAEEISAGVVRFHTFIRAEYGTTKASHIAGTRVAFFPVLVGDQFLEASTLPYSTPVNLHLTPVVTGANDANNAVTDEPSDLSGKIYDGDSIRPFSPELVSASKVGTTWTVKMRPRLATAGAGNKMTIQDDAYTLLTDLTGLSLRFAKIGSTEKPTVPAGQSFTVPPFPMPAEISIDSLQWNPDDGSATGGIITAVVTFDSNPANLLVWGVNSLPSNSPLSIPEP